MQWTRGKNLGFSEGCEDSLYLPVDDADDAPTVEAQENDPESLISFVREILALRHKEEDLQADAELEILCAEKGKPFVYRRGSLTIAVNPSEKEAVAELSVQGEIVYIIGNATLGSSITLAPQSFVIVR
jgi:maltose alpha-D-glucosyltransferase/alpha-amylase